MEAKRHALVFLGLSARDMRVLKSLDRKKPRSAPEIAFMAKVPRTTAYETLQKLHSRSLAHKVTVGERIYWKAPSPALLKRHLETSADILEVRDAPATPQAKAKAVYTANGVSIRAVTGAHELINVYATAYAGYENERVFLTQFSSGLKAFWGKTPIEKIKWINEIASNHKNILEVLATESTKKQYARLASSDAQWTVSAGKRTVDISVLADELFPNQKSELCIFRNTVMLTDWEAETGVLIESSELARMLRSFFRIAKNQGELFDNASFLRMLATIVGASKETPPQDE